jgi:hypothetical protein
MPFLEDAFAKLS